jgi:hypothetical protein
MRAEGLWTFKDLGPGNPVVVEAQEIRPEDWNTIAAKVNAEHAERLRKLAEGEPPKSADFPGENG